MREGGGGRGEGGSEGGREGGREGREGGNKFDRTLYPISTRFARSQYNL